MDKNRELFLNLTSSYFDNKIVYEIYNNDMFSICNLANQCYVLFVYPNNLRSRILAKNSGILGLTIGPEHVKSLVADNSFVYRILAWDKKTFDAHAILLNDSNYNWFMGLKNKNDLNGPRSEIDYEMENSIMNKGRSK